MAGRPRYREMERKLDELGVVEGMTGIEWLCEQVAGGQTVASIAKNTLGVSIGQLYQWISAEEDRKKAFTYARTLSASAHADRALRTAEAIQDKDDAARARVVADVRLRMARAFDPQTFGDNKQVNLAVNVTHLHLDALRARPFSRPQLTKDENDSSLPALPSSVTDAEVIQVVAAEEVS